MGSEAARPEEPCDIQSWRTHRTALSLLRQAVRYAGKEGLVVSRFNPMAAGVAGFATRK